MRVKINKRHQKLLLLQRIDLISEKQKLNSDKELSEIIKCSSDNIIDIKKKKKFIKKPYKKKRFFKKAK